MKPKGAWTVRSFLICFACNAVLAVLLFMMADKVLDGLNEWVSPFLGPGAPSLPENVRSALSSLGGFVASLRENLAVAIGTAAGAAAAFTWLLLLIQGRALIGRAEKEAAACAPPAPENNREETESSRGEGA
jgi:hypothetical protein